MIKIKKLTEWLLFSMSAQKDIEYYTNISLTDRFENNKYMGKLLTSYYLKIAPDQFKLARKKENLSNRKTF